MASVTYGKCNLWQVLLMASVTYGKRIMASVIMANVTKPQVAINGHFSLLMI